MSVEIVKGEDKTFSIDIKDANGDAFDLTGFTELTAEFAGTAGKVTLTTAVDPNGQVASANPVCGKMEITLTDVGSALLESGDTQDLEIIIEDSSNELTILQLTGQLKVKERLIS